MATIYDVARRAGVSAATVSRVLNGIAVAPAMAEAVREAAAELGFVPNRNARRLRTSSSEIIAMMIPDIENPFFTVISRAVEDVARDSGYSVMFCNTDESADREQQYLRVAVSEPVAGIIIAPSSNYSNLDLPLERGVPTVCIDRSAFKYDLDTVIFDNRVGAEAATELLLDAGYRRIACISGPANIETADERMRGWADAIGRRTGEPAPTDLVYRTDYSISGGEQATHLLLDRVDPPDAIFAANNKIAAGAIRALADRGQLPPRVGIVSFGGLPLILLVPTGVLVTHLPAREMGIQAATMLLERIRGEDGPARHVVLPVIISDEESGLTHVDGRTEGISTRQS